jgi:ribosomal protein S18 acetylase RimI-like enzyme
MPATIRAASAADALPLATLHVASWQETYAGLMPDTVLSALSVADRASRWQTILSQPDAFDATAVFVAERDGQVVGFGSCGKQRTPALRDRGFTAEVNAVYVLRVAQARGVGSALMGAMTRVLAGRGHEAASLWVLRENALARGFYERLGGEVVSQKEERREDVTLVEVAYGWRDLHRLLAHASKRDHAD